jgi:hypothetical protein
MGRTKEQKFRLAVLEEACRVPTGSRVLPCPLAGPFWKDLSSIRLRAFPLKNVWMSCQARASAAHPECLRGPNRR